MNARISVRADAPNSFAKKNGERVNERLLTVLDMSPDSQMAETFEVVIPGMDFAAPNMKGRQGTLFIESFVARQNGVRVIGAVTWDELKNAQGGPVAVK